jgi:drug/metabolite transporter (DMT)-like permease
MLDSVHTNALITMKRGPKAAFLLLGLVWGSNFLFMKWAVALISPAQVVFLRVLFGFLPILGLALYKRALRRSDLRHWRHFAVMSVMATSFYYYAFVKGTALLPSGVAGMLSGVIPLFTYGLTALGLRSEPLSARKLGGVSLGFLGVMLVARPWATGHAAIDLTGVAYILLGAFSLASSFVYARRFIVNLGIQPLALSTYQIGCALLTLAMITPYAGMLRISANTTAAVGLVAGLGLCGTGVAYVLYYYIVSETSAVFASAVTYLPPIVALALGHLLAHEPLVPSEIAAVLVISCGVALASGNSAARFPVRSATLLNRSASR